jgi:L-fuculose-phosphate aldolase
MDDIRRQVALGCQALAFSGQSDLIWGHVSVRDPDGRGVWMKAAGLGFDEVTADSVILVSPDGELLEGEGKVHVEYPIHTEIIRARPDVAAVVHSHAAGTVAFGATNLPMRPIGHEATLFGPPDIVRFTETGDLIRTPKMGATMAIALRDRNAMLLVNHGMVTVGHDVATAIITAIMLERACRLQLTVEATGANYSWSSDAEALEKRENCYGPNQIAAAWKYLVRKIEAAGAQP